ncbi:endonuclease/exonuclease/phosphatase family protein [Ahrensia sp. 13_GOM-1096m]|uniref:endonuclease/exonuclease/phosphatase family protein n=1 Tax=Ahrensia sp. 13_GOM-1096m TaxID=1380380 RepID=UPI00047AA380|nr:endonuclease/exonuclease/phosphatase family protein [Ahrensia sp. 13_GOM-1096m]
MIGFLGSIAVICLLTSTVPLLPIGHGAVRAFDFPRLQIATLSGVTFLIALIVLPYTFSSGIVFLLLVAALALQLTKIAKFSPLWRRVVCNFDGNEAEVSTINLMVSNVKMGNRDYGRLIHLIKQRNPDIALLIEVDNAWMEALSDIVQEYKYNVSCPSETSYGMLIVSKYPLISSQINYLLKSEVPSFDIVMEHDSGDQFRLIALHPEPPVLTKDTVGRDGEISIVAKKVRNYDGPLIVAGDLNDVAWSRTTRRFMRVSRLLDPREGRGMYNTFDARYIFIRWPLDHIFHSGHFKIIHMERMPKIGSDHFPMFYKLALDAKETQSPEISDADNQDVDETDDVIEEAKDKDDDAVGTDWEK